MRKQDSTRCLMVTLRSDHFYRSLPIAFALQMSGSVNEGTLIPFLGNATSRSCSENLDQDMKDEDNTNLII